MCYNCSKEAAPVVWRNRSRVSDRCLTRGVIYVSDTLVSLHLMWSPMTTKTGSWSPVTMSHRKVAAGEHKIRKVFTHEHLNAALNRAPLTRRVQRIAIGVYNAPVSR